MARYGNDFGRWGGRSGGYDRERGYQGGFGGGYGRGDFRPGGWQNYPGEGAWMGDSYSGNFPMQGYDFDYGGGFGSGYSNYGGDYATGRGGWSEPGGGYGRSGGGRERGFPGGPGGYDMGMDSIGDRGGRRGGPSNLRAADIMTEEPETVGPDTTLEEVARKMRDLDVGIIPVVEGDQNRRLRGVITDRDITVRATAEGRDARSTKVSDVMTPEVGTVNKNDRIRDVLEVMRREQVKRVPVTDRDGRLVGIIAEADLLSDYEGQEQERMLEDTLERVYQPSRSRGERNGGMQARDGGRSERPAAKRDDGEGSEARDGAGSRRPGRQSQGKEAQG